MNIESETIRLKKVSKKLWQHGDSIPKRVELAALDYLKAQGWKGYFTEQSDFDSVLLYMMCWADHDRIASISKIVGPYPKGLFAMAQDGFFPVKQKTGKNKYFRRDLIKNAEAFDPKKIPEILDTWRKKKARVAFVTADSPRAEELTEYFELRGRDYFLNFLDKVSPAERHALSVRVRQLVERTEDWKLSSVFGYRLGWHNSDEGQRLSDDELDNYVMTNYESPLRDEIFSISKEVRDFEASWVDSSIHSDAVLDLHVWKEGKFASVEVKSPNDRLRRNQEIQLERDAKEGRHSWVINVVEL